MWSEADRELLRMIYNLSKMFGIEISEYCIRKRFHIRPWFTAIVRNLDDATILSLRNTVSDSTMTQVVETELTNRGLIS